MRKSTVVIMAFLFLFWLCQGVVFAGDVNEPKENPSPEETLGFGPEGSVEPVIDPPSSMRNLVLHVGHREVKTLNIANTEFRYVAPFSKLPFLLWPSEGDKAKPFAHDRAAVGKWLEIHRKALGVTDFKLLFRQTADWWGNEVWSFDLERDGFTLHGAHIDVHWRDGALEGILCNLPGPVLQFDRGEDAPDGEADPDADGSNRIWFPVPRGVGWTDGATAVLARVKSEAVGPNIRTKYTHPSGKLLSTVVSSATPGASAPPRPHQWTEYTIPWGTFPDQISSDSQGMIWYSQPLNDRITVFDPVSETFDLVVTGNDDPDGLTVDRNDRVWSGLYNSNKGLGRVDAETHEYTVYAPPYSNSLMAIPFSTCRGRVWVSDHIENRMSEFNPSTLSWEGTYIMPTSSCWVVDTAEDPETEILYFTEYNVNQLGMKEPGEPIQDIPVSSGGPAFNGYSNGKVYYTLWSRSVLGAYDVTLKTNMEYNHPVSNEYGGPMDVLSNGDVVVGSLNSGYVFILRIATETWESYKIPTDYPGLKDGLHVDANDVIWVTESYKNKIAKLEIGPVPDLTISLAGECPGTVSAHITGAFPEGEVSILYAPSTGSARIPCGNDCGGRELGLGRNARLVTTVIANSNGEVFASRQVPAHFCDGYVQAVDMQSCLTSNIATLP
jgi:streptogramin lyase